MVDFLDLGIAGVLAVALFFFLRHLVGQMRQDRMFMEDRMATLIEHYHQDSAQGRDISQQLAESVRGLKTWLEARNGKSKE